MKKTCFKCNLEQELSSYQKDKANKDGLKGTCKKCLSTYHRIYKGENSIIRNSEYRLKHAQAQKKYRDKKKLNGTYKYYRGNRTLQSERWRNKQENKIKKSAHDKLYLAMKRGNIIKKPCVVCNDLKSNGHHEDYSKPLDVIWLCNKHHYEHHQKSR